MLTLDCRREPCKQRVWGEAFQADRATSLTGVQGALCVGPAPAGPGDVVMRGCCHDLGLIGQPPLAEIPPKSGSLVLPSGSPQQTVSNRLGCECGGDPAGGLSLAPHTGCQPSLFSWAGPESAAHPCPCGVEKVWMPLTPHGSAFCPLPFREELVRGGQRDSLAVEL